MNDKDDDEIDEAFLRRKRRKSNNILPTLGIMAVFMAPGLFAVLVYIVQSNKGVPIPEEVVQVQRPGDVIPPTKDMGEVYGRLAIYGGIALVGLGGIGLAAYQGATSQSRRGSGIGGHPQVAAFFFSAGHPHQSS